MSKIIKYMINKKILKMGLILGYFSLILNIFLFPTTRNINLIIFLSGILILKFKYPQ